MAHESCPTAGVTTLLGSPERGAIRSWAALLRVGTLAVAAKGSTGSLSSAGRHAGSSGAAANDIEDIRLARQGDSDAYRRLVERHQDHVARILWRFSRDRLVHEELVQDVFVEAYLSLNGYRGKAPFGHWLARIATRVGYRYWKEKARQKAVEPFSIEEWDGVADDDERLEKIDPERAAGILHQVLAQLPPRDRLVLVLRYLEGCDVAETARRTGWTRAMVKVQALRARSKLKRLLERRETELIE
jgi:RNA polymerase sigma-70 factor (ECF subfamily)